MVRPEWRSGERRVIEARPRGIALLVAAQVIVLDLAVKQLVQRAPAGHSTWGPISLVRTYNEGLVLGLATDLGPGILVVATGVIAVVVTALVLRGGVPPLPGGLLLGGAVANVADRLADGRVTDLLTVGRSPVFNLADVSITVGFLLLVAMNVLSPEETDRDTRHSSPRGSSPRLPWRS